MKKCDFITKCRKKWHKQKYKCHSCNKKFFARTNIVDDGCFISNQFKYAIKLKTTYEVYQSLLYVLRHNNYKELEITLNAKYDNISDYMKTSIKTLKEYLPYIKNTLNNTYHNDYVEGNNNFIKVLKRIAFGVNHFIDLKQELWYAKIYYIWKKQVQISTHLFKFLYHYFGLHPLFDKEPFLNLR